MTVTCLNQLSQQLEALTAKGAEHFDPVGFRFITAMTQRAATQPDNVAGLLVEKSQAALDQYQQNLAVAHRKAIKQVQLINIRFPEHSAKAHRYLVSCQYREIAKLLNQLQSTSSRVSALSALTVELLKDEELSVQENKQETLDDLLRQQESTLLQSLVVGKKTVSSSSSSLGGGQQGELKSIRLFRESWSKIHSEQRLAKSINDAPASAGPLNEQRLMVRSLEMMQELSPKYLSRFVSYVDSLLWLEQAGKKAAMNKLAKKSVKKRKKKV